MVSILETIVYFEEKSKAFNRANNAGGEDSIYGRMGFEFNKKNFMLTCNIRDKYLMDWDNYEAIVANFDVQDNLITSVQVSIDPNGGYVLEPINFTENDYELVWQSVLDGLNKIPLVANFQEPAND